MTPQFYTTMEKDIEEWEKKYPNQQYTPKVIKEYEQFKKRWAGIE